MQASEAFRPALGLSDTPSNAQSCIAEISRLLDEQWLLGQSRTKWRALSWCTKPFNGGRVAPMKLTRKDRSLIAWMLYFSILFGAFVCAISHGQMAGMQLSGLGGQYCSFEGNFGAGADLDGSGIVAPNPATGSNCALVSLFSAIILAAFFGLLGLLVVERMQSLSMLHIPRLVRYRWPPANPRASPSLLAL